MGRIANALQNNMKFVDPSKNYRSNEINGRAY